MGNVTLDDRVAKEQGILSRSLDGKTVIVNLDSGNYFGLDPVGTRIWDLLAQQPRLSDLTAAIVREFDVDEATAAKDLLSLVEELAENGLVLIEPREGAAS